MHLYFSANSGDGEGLIINPFKAKVNKDNNTVKWDQNSIVVKFGAWTYFGGSIARDYNSIPNKIEVGKYCSIAKNVTFIGPSNHHSEWITTYPLECFGPLSGNPHSNSRKDVFVGDDVWIGEGVSIMPGVNIASGSIIGTSALLTSDTLPYGIYGGVPAKLIRFRFDQEIIKSLLNLQWWNFNTNTVKSHLSLIFHQPTNETLDLLFQIKKTLVSDQTKSRRVFLARKYED